MSEVICPECKAADKVFCPRNVDGRCLECGIELCAAHLMQHFKEVHCMALGLEHCSMDDEKDTFGKHFAGIFMGVLNDAAEIYASHLPKKGETWMLDSVDDMLSQWIGEAGEVLALFGGGKYSPGRCKKEILDVINMSLMVVKLIDEAEDAE